MLEQGKRQQPEEFKVQNLRDAVVQAPTAAAQYPALIQGVHRRVSSIIIFYFSITTYPPALHLLFSLLDLVSLACV